MRLFEITEASKKSRNRRNKLINFRQTIDSIKAKIKGKTLVVFDTETTGFSTKLPWVQVTEIAGVAIDADTGKIKDKFHKKLNLTPETKKEIERQLAAQSDGDRGSLEGPRGASIKDLFKMTRYGDKNAPFGEIGEVYQEWADWLDKLDSPVMVGQNAGFDMGHMWAPLKQLGIKRPKIGEVMDTMTMARTWIYPLLKAAAEAGDPESQEMIKGFDVKRRDGSTGQSFTLGKLGKEFNVEADHWHSGISDAMQTYGIFNKMMKFLQKAKASGYDDTDIFKLWHQKMSAKAFTYGKRPAFQSTVDSETKKGIKARGGPRKS